MIKFLVATAMTTILMSSLASTVENQLLKPTLIGASAQTVTKKDRVRVNTRTISVPKPKLFRSNPLRKSQILGGTDPSDAVDDEDYIVARNRNKLELKKQVDNDVDLPEHIRWRLFLARTAALAVHRAKNG